MHQLGSLNGRVFSSSETQEMLSAMVLNDQWNYETIIHTEKLLFAIIAKLKAKGLTTSALPPRLTTDLFHIKERYRKRQKALQESPSIRTSNWFGERMEALTSWLGLNGLGAAPAVGAVPLAIGAVVIITASIFIYNAFRPHYSDSERDLVVSRDLKKALESLDPETAKEVQDDLEKQIDKAYKAGLNKGAFGSLLTIGKFTLYAAGGYYLVKTFGPVIKREFESAKSKAKAVKEKLSTS